MISFILFAGVVSSPFMSLVGDVIDCVGIGTKFLRSFLIMSFSTPFRLLLDFSLVVLSFWSLLSDLFLEELVQIFLKIKLDN